MKLGLKKGGKSFLPFRISRASSRFSLFLKVRSASNASGNVPVYLSVYDLTSINGYMYWAGLGIFHTGVEVHGVEYAFGAHDYPTTGIFEVDMDGHNIFKPLAGQRVCGNSIETLTT